MMGIDQKGRGDGLEQTLFDRKRCLAGGQFQSVRNPEDMRIDRHGRLAEGGIEHDIGGFAPDAGQGLERVALSRHLALVKLEQHRAGLDQVAGFRVIQTDGPDVGLQPLDTERRDGGWRAGHRKELAGGDIHAAIGGLCRQQHRHQQFKGC